MLLGSVIACGLLVTPQDSLLAPLFARFGLGGVLPAWVLIANMVLWRALYNLGLGIILRTQSRSRFITHWVARLAQKRTASGRRPLLARAVNSMLARSIGVRDPLSKLPPDFNAWVRLVTPLLSDAAG